MLKDSLRRNNLSHQKSANRRLDREIITHNTDEDIDFNEEFIHKSAVKDRIQANNRETDREIQAAPLTLEGTGNYNENSHRNNDN